MNFNSILYRFGLDPSNFINEENEPIKTVDGFIYDVRQRTDIRKCPHCGSLNISIKDYNYVEIYCNNNEYIKDTLRVKKVRFICKDCHKSYTPQIKGVEAYSKISSQMLEMILKDFTKISSFNDIALRYGLTRQRVIQIFDEKIKNLERKPMPYALCIDEIHFNDDYNQNYVCVLYDFNKREIVDIIRNRKTDCLYDYFNNISEIERNNVVYFISDLHDSYKTIKKKYFNKSIHVVDIFHVISKLSRIVNKIRSEVMNSYSEQSLEYRFMKKYWKLFLCKREDINDNYYLDEKTGEYLSLKDFVFRCISISDALFISYNVLQDLYHYNQYFNSQKQALNFVINMCNRLRLPNDKALNDVANKYLKWQDEIANGIVKTKDGIRYSNGIAESINNHLKTIIKISYGYHNFERFRKRAMIIDLNKKGLNEIKPR